MKQEDQLFWNEDQVLKTFALIQFDGPSGLFIVIDSSYPALIGYHYQIPPPGILRVEWEESAGSVGIMNYNPLTGGYEGKIKLNLTCTCDFHDVIMRTGCRCGGM